MTGTLNTCNYYHIHILTTQFIELYKVLFAYDTDKQDELALKQGETIRITSKDSPDWWLAERLDTKESGLVPSNVGFEMSFCKTQKKVKIVLTL
jgi:hypothetical protein